MSDDGTGAPLHGRRIAVPESREADRLAQMLEAYGAETVRCPLVMIVDAPDPQPIEAWLQRFVATPCDDLILLTGEGLRRFDAHATQGGFEVDFHAALARTRKITRGPKPASVLRKLGLVADLRSEAPTTEGVIATLAHHDLRNRRVGVQLYPDSDDRLVRFLGEAGATADPVVPYAYASQADDERVVALIDRMAAGDIDAIAFTSSPQVRRLFAVAGANARREVLPAALAATIVAAVGPVVAGQLQRRGVTAAIQPDGAYFMKPLVSAIVAALARWPNSPKNPRSTLSSKRSRTGGTMEIQPYLFFDGRCEEAFEFYRRTLGAEATMMVRFRDGPDKSMIPPGSEDKIMHLAMRIGGSTILASDGECRGQSNFQGFSLSLTAPDAAAAERVFAALGEGGQVRMPLTKTFFSSHFGMLADRFGVAWMIYVAP